MNAVPSLAEIGFGSVMVPGLEGKAELARRRILSWRGVYYVRACVHVRVCACVLVRAAGRGGGRKGRRCVEVRVKTSPTAGQSGMGGGQASREDMARREGGREWQQKKEYDKKRRPSAACLKA